MRNVGIFENVSSDDREGLMGKAYTANKYLKIMSIVQIVFVSVLSFFLLLATCSYAEITNMAVRAGAQSKVAAQNASILSGVIFILLLILIVLGITVPILTIWYSGKVKQDIEDDVIPSLTLAYVLIVLSVLGVLGNIYPKFHMIGLGLEIFQTYLWFVLIDSIRKVDNMYL